jgi:hypothetical protein
MATRSIIGIKNADGAFLTVYCHFDGYLTHHGPILEGYYNSEKKVRELLSYGDMSSLEMKISPDGDNHSYDNPEPNVCVFYGRDRGESNMDAVVSVNEHELNERVGSWYCYIFDNGEWLFREAGDIVFSPLRNYFQFSQ